MDRAEQLRTLAELYSRVEDGEADILTTTVSNETIMGGVRITVDMYSTVPLTKNLAAQQTYTNFNRSGHTHSTSVYSRSGAHVNSTANANPFYDPATTSSWTATRDTKGSVTLEKDSQ